MYEEKYNLQRSSNTPIRVIQLQDNLATKAIVLLLQH